MNPTIKDALIALVPDVVCSVIGVYPDYELNWISPLPQPVTREQIDAKYLELLAQVPYQECKAQAMSLLARTDWVNQPDVRDPANSPHLTNAAEFDAYRLAVRQYAVYPVADPVWPTLPVEIWN